MLMLTESTKRSRSSNYFSQESATALKLTDGRFPEREVRSSSEEQAFTPRDGSHRSDAQASCKDSKAKNVQKKTSMSDSDSNLVKRVQHGDQRAFDLLVLKYQHKIQSLVGRYVREADVQDVAQEAFIKAYRAIKNFRAESAFYTWLYRIAVNTAKNHLVSRSRRPPDSDVDVAENEVYSGENVLHDVETPQNRLQAEEVGAAVRTALDTLPNDLRTAVTLREFDGLSYEAIAEIMECPVGTVRSRIFRAREAIDKAVRPLLGA